MREIDYPALDTFIEKINPVEQTTRRSSEDFFRCPALPLVARGELQVRTLIDMTLGGLSQEATCIDPVPERGTEFLDKVKENFWQPIERVKDEVLFWGAADFDNVDSYLRVHYQRHEGEIRRSVREQYSEDNAGIQLLNGIEVYADRLNLDIPTAARLATTHVKYRLPGMKARAAELRQEGVPAEQAGKQVFQEFADIDVPRHILAISNRNATGNVATQMNKPSFYGVEPMEDVSPPLLMALEDAKGLMAVYPLEKMPYNAEELMFADEILQDPALRSSIMLFQMKVVDYAKDYLVRNPERMQARERLYPFTEFFVVEKGNNDPTTALVQNPKLLQVMSNNYVPAIASILLRDETPLHEMTSEQLVESAEEAKRRRVFQLQIGKFNNYDPSTNTVELDAIFNRMCPAMQMLTTGLKTWMPRIYAHSTGQM